MWIMCAFGDNNDDSDANTQQSEILVILRQENANDRVWLNDQIFAIRLVCDSVHIVIS